MQLPKRKKNRLEGYDYSSCGGYFVTLCVTAPNVSLWNMKVDCINPNELPLSQYGKIVETAICAIPSYYDNVNVDKYCIMPDHIHMILSILADETGRTISPSTLSVIIGSLKRWVSKQIGFSIWQKSFHDKIIRNQESYLEMWRYIEENPMKKIQGYYDDEIPVQSLDDV